MDQRPTARRCRICRAPEHGRHKTSCDYARYPSRYPDGPVYVDALTPKGQPIQGTGYSPAQMVGADTTDRPTASIRLAVCPAHVTGKECPCPPGCGCCTATPTDRPKTPRLDVLIDRACRHLTPAEGRALRNGWAELGAALADANAAMKEARETTERVHAELKYVGEVLARAGQCEATLREERDTYRAAWHSARDRARKRSEERDRARRWAVHLENENARTADELAGSRATIDHMSAAMSWIAGHDRQGLDHLEEAQYEARARESAIEQARSWARRAERAEQQTANVRAECDAITDAAQQLDYGKHSDAVGAAVRRIRAALDAAEQPPAGERRARYAESWQGKCQQLEAELVKAHGVIDRVRQLHVPIEKTMNGTICAGCHVGDPFETHTWPCPTVQALDNPPADRP